MDKNRKSDSSTESAMPIMDQPESAFEQINKYGTYEIQPTMDSGNDFPKISTGMSKKKIEKERAKKD